MMLMASPISALLSLLAVLALPSNDLLDYVPAATYWRLNKVEPTTAAMALELAEASDATAAGLIDKLSDPDPQIRLQAKRNLARLGRKALPLLREAINGGDPETAAVAHELIAKIGDQSRPKSIRRLMAIRALGEGGDAAAVAVLEPLLKSTEPFEAEYAAAAIALLHHQIPAARASAAAADRMADAWHLPADCSLVWQTEAHGGHPVSLVPLLAQEMGGAANGPAQRVMDDAIAELIHAAEAVGNVRLQSITVGLSGQIAPQTGFVVMVLRGQYDSVAFDQVLQDRHTPVRAAGGMKVYGNADIWFFMPGDDRLVVIIGPGPHILDSIIASVMNGKNDLHDSPDLSPMLKAVDATQPTWAVAKVSPSYKILLPVLAPFDTLSLGSRVQDGMLHVTVSAAGSDPAGAAASVNSFSADCSQVLSQARNNLQGQSMYAPLLKVLESIHCQADGGTATIALEMPPSLGDAMLEAAGPAAQQP
jgi:hypothetical protein